MRYEMIFDGKLVFEASDQIEARQIARQFSRAMRAVSPGTSFVDSTPVPVAVSPCEPWAALDAAIAGMK